MPLPLVPIAVYALASGSVALATYKLSRKIEPGRRDQRVEDAMDEVVEGATLRREPEQGNMSLRFKRTIRFGDDGSAYEIDAAAFARLRFKKV